MSNQQIGSFLGRGWSFPPRFEKSGGAVMSSEEQDVVESLRILLSTARGERVLVPAFGCDLESLQFESLSRSTKTYIIGLISRALLHFEHRIKVDRVELDDSRVNEGRVDILVEYRIKTTNSRENLVLPFYVESGIIDFSAVRG